MFFFLALGVPATGAVSLVANDAPNPPVLLTPSDGATLPRQGNQPFSISAVDPNGDLFTGTVVIEAAGGVEVARFPTSPAPSGVVSYGLLTSPLNPGLYKWTAVAIDVHGAVSESAIPRSFTVNPPPTGGAGAVKGTIDFDVPGAPPAVCEPTSTTWHLVSPSVVLNTALVGFVGALTMDGSGTSACESVRSGDGIVSLIATGTGPFGSTLSCTLEGPYARVGVEMMLFLSGNCEVNDNPVSRVSFDASLAFVPVAADVGTTSPVQQALVTGGFVVVPE